MQNPPAIPTIPICWLYCIVMNTQFIIDWHNYAHSLMALSLGNDHILVNLTKYIEKIFGRRANNNFCVTKAMKEDLEKTWGIQLVMFIKSFFFLYQNCFKINFIYIIYITHLRFMNYEIFFKNYISIYI